MTRCDRCGEVETLPYTCHYCGGRFCSTHRLPENHDCPGLDRIGGGGVFDSGFNGGIQDATTTSTVSDRVRANRTWRTIRAYARGNTTFVFLVAMWATFIAQYIVLLVGGQTLHQTLFVLTPQHPERVWTWITSIFAHGGLIHIAFNSIVIFFFGPLVERYIGSRKFALLFILSGVLAGLSQIGFSLIDQPAVADASGVLGASGAALAIMGLLTVFNPNLRVYLYAIIPLPIWVLTAGIAIVSIAFIAMGDPAAFNIAHVAHLVGLLVGVVYGVYLLKTQSIRPPTQLRVGGGPPGSGRQPPRRRI